MRIRLTHLYISIRHPISLEHKGVETISARSVASKGMYVYPLQHTCHAKHLYHTVAYIAVDLYPLYDVRGLAAYPMYMVIGHVCII
jgi:hypothetical protein